MATLETLRSVTDFGSNNRNYSFQSFNAKYRFDENESSFIGGHMWLIMVFVLQVGILLFQRCYFTTKVPIFALLATCVFICSTGAILAGHLGAVWSKHTVPTTEF